jgi:hypothetical protein
MKFAITFGQKYDHEPHATLGDEVTGSSYLVVYANNKEQAREALHEALPIGYYLSDYAFIYSWDDPTDPFSRQIEAYDLKPLSKHLFVGAIGDWSWQEGPE